MRGTQIIVCCNAKEPLQGLSDFLEERSQAYSDYSEVLTKMQSMHKRLNYKVRSPVHIIFQDVNVCERS